MPYGKVVVAMCLVVVGCRGADDESSNEVRLSSPCDGETSAHQNFNAFWTYFDETYALFDLRLPDESWDELGDQACDAIEETIETDGDMTSRQLFDLMVRTAEHLDDGHVAIEAPELDLYDDAWVSDYPYYDEVYELEGNVEDRYIDEASFETAGWEEFSWGSIGDIGYLSITSMSELDPRADPDATDQDDHSIEEAAAEAAMASAMEDLGDTSGLVVDIRANEGGWDTVSLVVAKWFAGGRTLAWSEQRRDGPGRLDFGPWEDTYVDAASAGAYDGPVVLLTSGGTFSAAETFVLAMRGRDHVTVMGERTAGYLSDQLATTLPNGWVVDLSYERYRAADGVVYEVTGVPVNIEAPLDIGALSNGQDTMLEAALDQLGG